MKLRDKVAIVTGGSGGIGQGICDRLAKEGANVVINYRSAREDAEKAQESVRATGSEALIVKADLSKVEEINHMVQQAIERFGKVNILEKLLISH